MNLPWQRKSELAMASWLKALAVLLWLGVVVSAIAAVYSALRALASAHPNALPFSEILDHDPLVHVSVPLQETDVAGALPEGYEAATGTVSVPIVPTDGHVGAAVVQALATLPWALLLIVVFSMLLRLLPSKPVKAKALFNARTVRGVRRVGWFALISTLVVTVFQNTVPSLLSSSLPPGTYLELDGANVATPGWSLVFVGIVALFFAEMIRWGSSMRGELAKTV